jgi:hypothetical protein
MRALRILLSVVIAFPAAIAVGGAAAAASSGGSYVCSGGNIPSGSYSSVLVTGACYVPSGLVVISGDLTVGPGALLDATTPAGFFGPTPASLPGIVQVGGNVKVQKGAVLFFGCDAAIVCPPGFSTYPGPPALYPIPILGYSNPGDFVAGNLVSDNALGVVVHSVKIGGDASLIGGGGGPAQLTGGPGSGACFDPTVVPVPSPWSEDPTLTGTPVYSDFEENSIGGSLKVIGLQTCWMGALRNKIGGNLIDLNNTFGDPDANEMLTNIVGGNIICFNNNSVVQIGDSAAPPNVISGNALGECAFSVIDPTGGPISVKA